MNSIDRGLERRVEILERRLRRTQLGALGLVALVVTAAAGGRSEPTQKDVVESIRARSIQIVDDEGHVRIALGQDPKDTQRRSRACGLTIRDKTGAERGGMSTFDDMSVVLALDAPHGVGNSMPDRVAMGVDPDGSSHVMIIDNQTLVPVRLASDAAGGGGLEFIGYDFEKKIATVKRTSFGGESQREVPLGDGK
jgi:hypothetical protein